VAATPLVFFFLKRPPPPPPMPSPQLRWAAHMGENLKDCADVSEDFQALHNVELTDVPDVGNNCLPCVVQLFAEREDCVDLKHLSRGGRMVGCMLGCTVGCTGLCGCMVGRMVGHMVGRMRGRGGCGGLYEAVCGREAFGEDCGWWAVWGRMVGCTGMCGRMGGRMVGCTGLPYGGPYGGLYGAAVCGCGGPYGGAMRAFAEDCVAVPLQASTRLLRTCAAPWQRWRRWPSLATGSWPMTC
jgi:hypothetical protein